MENDGGNGNVQQIDLMEKHLLDVQLKCEDVKTHQ
jgi:hypothetical protein